MTPSEKETDVDGGEFDVDITKADVVGEPTDRDAEDDVEADDAAP